jgi:hypothetical protein
MALRRAGQLPCNERDELQDALDLAAAKFVCAAHQLSMTLAIMEETAYTLARGAVDVTRRNAEAARGALQKHRREHGC